jgi:adenylate kinase
MNIVLLGAPGAGKGTQAVLLTKKYSIPHISTGEILRARIKDGSAVGEKAKTYVESGQLVPDDIVIEMVKDRLVEPDCANGFILDGFPRNALQARALDECLHVLGKKIETVLNFDASESVILERLSGRRVCAVCNATFHVTNMPPKKEGICDACGSELIQRKDDSPETIKNRLQVYQETAEPLLDYYKKQGLLVTLPADKEATEIEELLDEHFDK